jgi:hypothetical protein
MRKNQEILSQEDQEFAPIEAVPNLSDSDNGEQANAIEGSINFEQMLNSGQGKSKLTEREKRILRARFVKGKGYEEIGKEAGPGTPNSQKQEVIPERVRQIIAKSLGKLKRSGESLPKDIHRELNHLNVRDAAKSIVDELYPNDKNRFLMAGYLFDYLAKIKLSDTDDIILYVVSQIRNGVYGKEELSKEVRDWLKYGWGGVQGKPKISKAEVDQIISDFYGKIRQLIDKKFK